MKQHDIWLNFPFMFTFPAVPLLLADIQTVPVDFALSDYPSDHIWLLNCWTDVREYWEVVVSYHFLLILVKIRRYNGHVTGRHTKVNNSLNTNKCVFYSLRVQSFT